MDLRSLAVLVLLGCSLLTVGCKSTDEHLEDVGRSLDGEWELDPTVYDAGQLVHEAMAAIVNAESLNTAQVGRAVYYAAQVVERNGVPLLRSDAVTLLAHLTERIPLPPRSAAYREVESVSRLAREQAEQLLTATEPLSIGIVHIPALDNPDRVIAQEAIAELERLTGESLGRDADAWRAWWEENEAGLVRTALEDTEEPLDTLANLRYPSLSSSRAILGLLTLTLNLYDVPELTRRLDDATMALARQVAEYGVEVALQDEGDPQVRLAGVRAAEKVRALEFGPLLGRRLTRETDSDVMGALVRTARYYPGKDTVRGLIRALDWDSAAVRIQAHDALVSMVDVDHGEAVDQWALWWEREGQTRWR